jgi:ubiquinone/menaquinone biosynthesis C-methylase UbiE
MPDPDAVKHFGVQLLQMYTGAALTKMIEIGYQTGLFEASKGGPVTLEELSRKAGLRERYVKEWLGGMTTGGIYSYDPASGRYTFPDAHAALLTGDTPQNLTPMSRMINHFGTHLPKLIACFREGGGVPYSAYRPVFTQCMDDVWRRIYDQQLISGFIAAAPRVMGALQRGIRVLDIGCGTGHAINLLAREYPDSSFVGYDIAEDAIARARKEAQEMGLKNASFEVLDVTDLAGSEKFDLITAFDAIHDQRAPAAVLQAINRRLAPSGTFLMVEFKFSSLLEENLNNPFATLYYGISLMHCMTVSLAAGGPGLGAVWGEQTARRMLAEAGFGTVSVVDTPRPQNCIFICGH